MSGKKGMVHYSGEMKEQVRKEIVAGKSQREVSRKYGISRVGADFDLKQSCGKLHRCLRAGLEKHKRSKTTRRKTNG